MAFMTTPSDPLGSVVCNLSIGKRPERLLEWSEVGRLAIETEELDDGIQWQFHDHMAGAVESLAAREIDCCGSWLDATTSRSDGRIRLRVTTSHAAGLDVIRRLSQAAL